MIEPGFSRLSIVRQCALASISRSSFYYTPAPVEAATLALMRVIDEAFLEMPWYGSRQMARHLRRLGHEVGRKRVRRLMRLMGLAPIYQKPRTSDPYPQHRVYPYLLRGLAIERADQVWCADVTFIPMQRGFLYLVAVMDWASRKVLSWRLSNTLDAAFCVAALQEAIAHHGVPEIFNTDQGSQFTSFSFTTVLREAGVRISMDGRGRCLDNVFIERLWRSLKYECVYLNAFETARRCAGASPAGSATTIPSGRTRPSVEGRPTRHTMAATELAPPADNWRHDRNRDYSLAEPSNCPNDRDHLIPDASH